MLSEFINKYKQIFKDDFDLFFESLKKSEYKYFRVNSARDINYLQEFENLEDLEEVEGFFAYKYNDERVNISKSIGFLTGGLYIQNISSLLPPKILKESLVSKNPIVLDMCAAPGGKTTYLSELIKRGGLIIANEISSKRLKALNFNIAKYGSYNVKTVSMDGRLIGKRFENFFDAVMLDAPCSNENKILKNETVQKFWSEDFVKSMQKIQMDLIDSAFNALKDGGYLIYSTCTFSVEENEEVVEFLLKKYKNARLVDINLGRYQEGISKYDKLNEKVIRVFPHMMQYDGFFIALIQKEGTLKNVDINKMKKNEKFERLLSDTFTSFHLTDLLYMKNNKIFINPLLRFQDVTFPKILFKNNDFLLGSFQKDFMISTEGAWEFGNRIREEKKAKIGKEESIEYLNGFDINKEIMIENGVLFYSDIPVGPFKMVDKRIKNKIDRYFIYNRV